MILTFYPGNRNLIFCDFMSLKYFSIVSIGLAWDWELISPNNWFSFICVNSWSMKSLPSLLWFQGGYDPATSLGPHTHGPNSEPLNNLICYVTFFLLQNRCWYSNWDSNSYTWCGSPHRVTEIQNRRKGVKVSQLELSTDFHSPSRSAKVSRMCALRRSSVRKGISDGGIELEYIRIVNMEPKSYMEQLTSQ